MQRDSSTVTGDCKPFVWRNGLELAYLGKGLQLVGMLNLMIGLYIGLTDEHGMWTELYLLGIGSGVFFIGRLLEGRGKK